MVLDRRFWAGTEIEDSLGSTPNFTFRRVEDPTCVMLLILLTKWASSDKFTSVVGSAPFKSEILRAEWPVSNLRGFGRQQCVRFTSWSSIACEAPAKAETMVCNRSDETVFEPLGSPRRAAVVSRNASFVFVEVRSSMR